LPECCPSAWIGDLERRHPQNENAVWVPDWMAEFRLSAVPYEVAVLLCDSGPSLPALLIRTGENELPSEEQPQRSVLFAPGS
jgi:hypothetical protein